MNFDCPHGTMGHRTASDRSESVDLTEDRLCVAESGAIAHLRRAVAAHVLEDLSAHTALNVTVVRHQQHRPAQRRGGRLETCIRVYYVYSI